MAITVGTQSSITLTGSDQTLGSAITSGKTCVVQVDLNTMAAGDVVEIACYVKTAGSGGTARQAWRLSFANAQSASPVFISVPTPAPYSCEFKAKQPTGTGRTVDYVTFTL